MIKFRSKDVSRLDVVVAMLGLVFAGAALTVSAADDVPAESRKSVTTQYSLGHGELAATVTENELGPLDTSSTRSATGRAVKQSKTSPQPAYAPNTDFWFYDVDVELFQDQDQDGFFYGIDVLFDADTYFTAAEVYAVLYLSLEGGAWNEYAATENFTILGASPDDDYVVITELVAGYPTGSYDILIELFDAYDDSFVAMIGPDDTPELAFLPLEDSERDKPFESPTIVINDSGGGSLSVVALLLFACVSIGFRRHRSRQGR